MDYSDECEREDREWEMQEETRYTQAHHAPPTIEPPAPTAPNDGKHDNEHDAHMLVRADHHTVEPPNREPWTDIPNHTSIMQLHPPPWPNRYRHRHRDNDITSYSTTRSRPPPWPNKYRNRYQHNGKYTLAKRTVRQLLPWLNKQPTPSSILSIADSRPPPWPNQCHCGYKLILSTPHLRPPPWPIISCCTTQTSQNHRNAKRRVKAKSRIISDEVSV